MRTRQQRSARSGVAAVELAIACTFVLVPCAYGMIELARAVQVKMCLTDAARSGCRVACSAGMKNSDVTNNIGTTLTANGIASNLATVTVQVNGVTKDCSQAVGGDKISVTVSVPAASVNYMALFFMSQNAVESETLVMMRQG